MLTGPLEDGRIFAGNYNPKLYGIALLIFLFGNLDTFQIASDNAVYAKYRSETTLLFVTLHYKNILLL